MKKAFVLILINIIIKNTLIAYDTTRVLFIGNSITYFNNMPFTFEDISKNLGRNVKVTMYAPGGTGFINHVSDANVYNLFRNTWDAVVLQPGSNESAGTSSTVDQTIARGKILLDSIREYSQCAKVFLYQIPYGVPNSSSWNTYFAVQTMFRDSVGKMADSLKIPMIAAGECVRAYYTKYQNLALHGSYNDIHPGPLGSYLIACACYNTIFQDSISNCSYYGTIAQDSAQNFFTISDSVILKNKSLWRINAHNLRAEYSTSQSGLTLTFNNSSSNATSYNWSFGDGAVSNSTNPQHIYSSPGTYSVTLYAHSSNCVDSVTKIITITLTNTALQNSKANTFEIYPLPANDVLYIKSSDLNIYKIYDVAGKILITGKTMNLTTEIDLKDFGAGIYFLEINDQKIKLIKL